MLKNAPNCLSSAPQENTLLTKSPVLESYSKRIAISQGAVGWIRRLQQRWM
jgi:hypothetical protein